MELSRDNNQRIDIFKEFASYIEYPMVVFEAESGKVIHVNYEAEVLLGKGVDTIRIEPGRSFTKADFWNVLKTKKSLIWHRIRMSAGDKEHLVSGLVNEATVDGRLIYTVLFEMRADMNIGSLTLERIVNHGRIIAMHVSVDSSGERHVEYASQNINQYGYTRAQLYEDKIKVEDLVCPDDLEGLVEDVNHAIEQQWDESSYECRLLTEERELIPVRLLFHYDYDEQGRVLDYEVLAFDRKEELKKLDENQYLSNAMFKMKSVVIVKSFCAGKRRLKYISPNAGMLGMNVEALTQGNKLTEDYIHPEDRDGIIDSVYQAVANGIAEYEQNYRIVRDDGRMIWVAGHVTINRISDGEAEALFLLTDVTEQKELEHELAEMAKSSEGTGTAAKSVASESVSASKGYSFDDISGQLQLMAQALGRHSRYYCVALSEEGRIMTNPVGPADNLGLFYDLFERPEIRDRLNEIAEQARLQLMPKSIDIAVDGIPVHITFAPLLSDGQVKAFWVLAAFNSDGVEELGSVVEAQWQLANSIVDSYYAKDMVSEAVKNKKLTEFKLKREKQERRVLQEMLNISATGGETGLGEMCQRMSSYLSVSYIGIYTEDKETGNAARYYTWSGSDEDGAFFDRAEFSVSEFNEIAKILASGNKVMATGRTKDPFLRELLMNSSMKLIALEPMVPGVGARGYIIFGDKKRDEEFDKNEQHFVATAAKIVQGVVFRDKAVVRRDIIREGFLETYDHIKDAIFVKNNETGEIIFANKAMDKLFGYSIVGMQAQDIVNDQMEQYRMITGGMRKRVIANNKVSKWQSYLKELDQIMNVVEIRLNIFTATDLSLVILKKNKNK
ncbi:MAG: PAS domain-containing protein [Lachnospiraceae bacterium]|nr:PAS domain-containing protein [Lachnospiraceae bacterium]